MSRLVMMAWGITSRRTMASVIMVMAMVVMMNCQMNVRTVGMSRRLALRLVDVWHRNSP